MAWSEGDHPRDKDGEFSSGGGSGGSGGEDFNYRTPPKVLDGAPVDTGKLSSSTMLAIGGTAGIRINTSRKAQAFFKDVAANQAKAFESGWLSSPHPNHTIWHEWAHWYVKNNLGPDKDSQLRNLNGRSNPYFATMAAKVSKYAGTNGHEFASEVYAAKRAGRELDDDVVKFYHHILGDKAP